MKILIDGRVLAHGYTTGIQRHAQELTKALANITDIDIVIPKYKNRYYLQIWEHTLLPWYARKYDLLFSPSNIAPIFKYKNKMITTLHDTGYLKFPNSVSKSFYHYYKYLIPKNLRITDMVITISEYSKSEILKEYPFVKDKIYVIYNGIDHTKFCLQDVVKKDYILFIGSMNPRKNFVRLIQAYKTISSFISTKLIIVGSFNDVFSLSDEEVEIISMAKKDKKIVFLENVSEDELVKLYQEAKIFIFPSLYEGFGLPVLEAMACGTAVISSNIEVLHEVCSDAALYIDAKSVDDISKKILMLLNDENMRQQLIEKGVKRASEFTWDKSAKRHLELFEKVVSL